LILSGFKQERYTDLTLGGTIKGDWVVKKDHSTFPRDSGVVEKREIHTFPN